MSTQRGLVGVLLATGIGVLFPGAVAQEARVIKAKLGLSYMTQAQLNELWDWVDLFATAEAMMNACGKSTRAEERVRQATQNCVEEAALRTVAARYRAKIAAQEGKYKLPCDSPAVIKSFNVQNEIIAKKINEAASLCKSCLIC